MSKAARIDQPTQESLDDLPEIDVAKARVLGRGLRKDRKLPLRALRDAAGKTQPCRDAACPCSGSPVDQDSAESSVVTPKPEAAVNSVPPDLADDGDDRIGDSAESLMTGVTESAIPRNRETRPSARQGMAGVYCISEPMLLGERSSAPMRWFRSHKAISAVIGRITRRSCGRSRLAAK